MASVKSDDRLTGRTPGTGSLALPTKALRSDNELVFLLPDAHSPKSVGLSMDDRVLALDLRWIQFKPGSR